MEEETPIKGLTKWFKGLNTKSTSKLLLVYGESGIGKTYFIESHLSKKLKLKPLTNDKIDQLMDEKPSNYSSFLSLFFDVGVISKNSFSLFCIILKIVIISSIVKHIDK